MMLTATKARMPLAAMVILLGAVFGVLVATLRPTAAPEHETAEATGGPVARVAVVLDGAAAEEPVAEQTAAEAKQEPTTEPTRRPEGDARSEPQGTPKPRTTTRATGAVHGRLVPQLQGVVVFTGGAGVLPLDSQAVAWPLEPGGEVPTAVRWTTTGPDGRFRLDGLAPGALRVLVRPDLHARIERDDLWLMTGEELDLGDLLLEPAQARLVTVVTAGGRPAEDARLYLVPPAFLGAARALGPAACAPLAGRSATGEFPGVPLPLGRSLLLAVAPGNPPAWEEVFIGPGDVSAAVEIRLPPSQTIQGELIDLDGIGLAGLRIGALSLRAPWVTFETARVAGLPGEALAAWRTTTADQALRFWLDGLERDETVLLRALGDGRMDVPDIFAPDVLAGAGDRRVELFHRAGAELTFEAVDATGLRPVEPVQATLTHTQHPLGWGLPGLERLFSGSKGRWTDIRPRRAASESLFADLPESEDLYLWLRSGNRIGRSDGPFRLRTGERLDLGAIRMPEGQGALSVRVVTARDGAPLAGAACELVPVSERLREQFTLRDVTGGGGHARLEPQGSLPCDLLVRCEGFAPRRLSVPGTSTDQSLRVELSPGGTLHVLVLDAGRSPVRAEVLRRKVGAEVVSSLEEAYEQVLTDADGVAVFTGLEPGLVSVAARALPRSDLDLPADLTRMTWVATSVLAGGEAQLEAPCGPNLRLEVQPEAEGVRLPYALVRLSPDPTAFSDPYADAATLARWPTARCDATGTAVFEGLPPADYVLRVEHPDLAAFGRCVVRLEPGSQAQRVEVQAGAAAGWVLDENDGVFAEAGVVAWALGPIWKPNRQIEAGTSLGRIAPEPIVLGRTLKGQDGSFGLTGPRGVQTVLTGLDAASGYVGDFWLEQLPEVGEGEPVGLYAAPGARLDVVVVPQEGEELPRSLGVVAICLDQPWGRGVVAQPCEGNRLELDHVPQGRWQVCTVELASGHLILGATPWVEVDALPEGEPLYLRWWPLPDWLFSRGWLFDGGSQR